MKLLAHLKTYKKWYMFCFSLIVSISFIFLPLYYALDSKYTVALFYNNVILTNSYSDLGNINIYLFWLSIISLVFNILCCFFLFKWCPYFNMFTSSLNILWFLYSVFVFPCQNFYFSYGLHIGSYLIVIFSILSLFIAVVSCKPKKQEAH